MERPIPSQMTDTPVIGGDGVPQGQQAGDAAFATVFRLNNSPGTGFIVARALAGRYAVSMRHIFMAESKKKLWRPCREARALGL